MDIEVVDLFCGVGGLTCGLKRSGLKVIAGFDNDATCKYAYEHNNKTQFVNKNIRFVRGNDIKKYYSPKSIHILVGCAPCQPFSNMSFKRFKNVPRESDDKYDLLMEFGRIVKELKPTIISMENVPAIRKTNVYKDFVSILNDNGYYTSGGEVVYCPDYGIPQNRHRFVLLASKLGNIDLIKPTHDRKKVNINSFICNMPPIEAGEIYPKDPLHRSAALSKKNLMRIKASKQGGTWKDWPKSLLCSCHKKKSGITYSSVYGRMSWGKIGPTITTEFYSYGTGRFGHPNQNRAISLREGAILQTFPKKYNFIDPKIPFSMNTIARHIGNAVPVKLGQVIGRSIKQHLKHYRNEV
ncbi:MAG: DNA cytosine methyltransferase [Bacilli bacterium]|nr:DNA cytosine methyltransferase [Bacilli bacterium]